MTVVAILGLALPALTGCLKVDLAANVHSNDTVDGQMTVAVHREAVATIGDDEADDFVDSLTADFPGAYRTSDFDDGVFMGRTVYFADVPLSDFNTEEQQEGNGATLHIAHSQGRYTLSGHWNLPRPQPEEATAGLADSVVEAGEFTIAIQFPGAVTRHNGHLNGNTVTWNLKIGQSNELYAQAGEAPGARLALIVLAISLALLILVAIALLVQLRRHSVGRAPSDGAAPARHSSAAVGHRH
jgi:hypothetical protein